MTRSDAFNDPIETVRAAWGDNAPEEVVALAEACRSLGTQEKAARKIGYSSSVVSSVLGRKYKGSYPEVFASITVSLMRGSVMCPVLGAISGADCSENQRMDVEEAIARRRQQVFKACREGCPHSQLATYRHVQMRHVRKAAGPTGVLKKAHDAWSGSPPDWICDLATACEASSQNAVAARLGLNAAYLSYALRNIRPEFHERVRDVVRKRLPHAGAHPVERGEVAHVE